MAAPPDVTTTAGTLTRERGFCSLVLLHHLVPMATWTLTTRL